jgi:hypothetical protein
MCSVRPLGHVSLVVPARRGAQNTPPIAFGVCIQVKSRAIPVTGLRDVEASTFSLKSRITDGGEVSLTHRPSLPPGRLLVLISVRGRVDPRAIVQLERIMSTDKIQ